MGFINKVRKYYTVLADTAPAVYVGTYGKYNSGSIEGAWLKLDDYTDKDAFLKAAEELHKDEDDAELMFQDYEGFPKKYYSEYGLSDELWGWLKLDKNEKKITEVYLDANPSATASLQDIIDAYRGEYDSPEDWARQFIDDTGMVDNATSYMYMSDQDIELFADEAADNYVENLDEDSLLQEAGFRAGESELADEARDKVHDAVQKEIRRELKHDAVQYFIDNLGYDEQELINGVVPSLQFDYEAYARDADYSGDLDFIKHDNGVLVFDGSI